MKYFKSILNEVFFSSSIEFQVANPANMMNLDPPGISAGETGQLGWGWIWAVTWVYGWAPSVGVVCGALHELYGD